ncbi:unnamed protein product [Rhizoctonia solani]|nr:unnamed protein product [Rhizoctonia solani]
MPSVDQQTDYEKIRQQNMLNNEKLLQELMGQSMDLPTGLAAGLAVLGIAEPTPKPKKAAKPKAVKPKTTKPKVEKEELEERVEGEGNGTHRSARRASKPSVSFAGDGEGIVDRAKMPRMVSRPDKDWNEDDTEEGEDNEGGKVKVNKLCSAAAIHAPFVAGISGGPEGAYSVALSGGYDDDIDMGDAFTYTGSGGRDLKGTAKNPKNLRTAPQSSHQSFDHSFDKSLKVSSETRKPVRVIRGYKLPGIYAPESGYRYDGLYIVERAWMDNPKGWKVCKLAFRRIPGQPPIPRQGQAPKAAKADVEMKDADSEEEDEGEDRKSEGEEEAKPKTGSNVGPKSKGKAKVGSKSKVKVEEENEEEEPDEEPVPPKKGNKVGPKSTVKQESEELEEKPKQGRKVAPKSKAKDEEAEEEEDSGEEEQEPVLIKKGREVEPKSKIQSERDEPISKRGRKPEAQSELEENQEEEEEDNVPPAKRSKVEEGPKKRGRPAKK